MVSCYQDSKSYAKCSLKVNHNSMVTMTEKFLHPDARTIYLSRGYLETRTPIEFTVTVDIIPSPL